MALCLVKHRDNFTFMDLDDIGVGFPLLYLPEGYPKVSGLAAWSENCEWYSSLPLGAVVSLFCESV